MSKFLKSLLRDKANNKIFFPMIRSVRKRSIEIRKENYRWGAPDYKIYPSAIRSWNICPVEFIKSLETAQGNVIDQLDGIYRVRRGSAVHAELQEDLLISGKNYADPLGLSPELYQKLCDNRPEIPFTDPESGFSGRLDGCISFKGEPLPIEIKTTSSDIKTWTKNLPKPEHKIQGAFYCYFPNKLKYYPVKIKRFLLCYLNLTLDPANQQNGEEEFMEEYDSTLEDKTHLLVTHLTGARQAYINNQEVNCAYPLCRIHGKKK